MFLRYTYPVLLVLGAAFRLAGLEFTSRNFMLAVLTVYYLCGAVCVLSMFLYDIAIPEAIMMFVYPLMMAVSPAPYETLLLMLMMLAVMIKYKRKYKALITIYLVVCTLIGIVVIIVSAFFTGLMQTTVLSSSSSDNGKYRVDVVYSDKTTAGGSTYASLYQNYGNILSRDVRVIYNSTLGTIPDIKWNDSDTVNIDGVAINVHSSDTYNSVKSKK